MATRFGGKYSPGAGGKATANARRSKAGARVNFLFIVPIAILLVAFQSEPTAMFVKLMAFGDLMLAAWLTKEGLKAEDAYDARNVAVGSD